MAFKLIWKTKIVWESVLYFVLCICVPMYCICLTHPPIDNWCWFAYTSVAGFVTRDREEEEGLTKSVICDLSKVADLWHWNGSPPHSENVAISIIYYTMETEESVLWILSFKKKTIEESFTHAWNNTFDHNTAYTGWNNSHNQQAKQHLFIYKVISITSVVHAWLSLISRCYLFQIQN